MTGRAALAALRNRNGMRTMSFRWQTVVVGLLLWRALPLLAAGDPESPQPPKSLSRFEFLQIRMAIPVRITVYAADEATANQATSAAYRRFKELDRSLSNYDPDSELSLLCRNAEPGVPHPVSDDLFAVLHGAERISKQSGGAFDATVGPLTEIWRKARRRQALPEDAVREAALSRVGWRQIRLNPDAQTVTLLQPGMRLDLGGIAKGYAADEALRAMAQHGVTIALIDAGGDVVAGDPPPGAAAWRVGIAPLGNPRGEPTEVVELANAAVATSGDAVQFVEIDGVRYSHILDPRTGVGVTTSSSVTVIADDGMTADGLASAISVMGPVCGLDLAGKLDGMEALIVSSTGDGSLERRASSGFRRFLNESAP